MIMQLMNDAHDEYIRQILNNDNEGSSSQSSFGKNSGNIHVHVSCQERKIQWE